MKTLLTLHTFAESLYILALLLFALSSLSLLLTRRRR